MTYHLLFPSSSIKVFEWSIECRFGQRGVTEPKFSKPPEDWVYHYWSELLKKIPDLFADAGGPKVHSYGNRLCSPGSVKNFHDPLFGWRNPDTFRQISLVAPATCPSVDVPTVSASYNTL